MLPRLAYLTLCRSIQLLALLARGDAAKDLEILVLRHQLTVLHRQVPRPRLEPTDRALLAAISRALPRTHWSCFLVAPETLLRWHRRLVAGAWTHPHRSQGRPALAQDIQQLIVRLARETPAGATSASKASCSGLAYRSLPPPSAPRSAATGSIQPHGGRRQLGGRSCTSRPPGSSPATSSPSTRCGCGGCTCCSSSSWTPGGSTWPGDRQPDGVWVAQQARNLLLVLAEQHRRVRLVLRDRDTKFCRAFDDAFRCEGAEIVLTPVQAPNANAYAERWVGTVRAECLDWLLIMGRGHLAQVLRIYVQHYNQHRPHRALGLEAPDPPAELNVTKDRQGKVCRRDLLGGLLHK